MKADGCREAVLEAFQSLHARHGRDEFELGEVVREVLSQTSDFEESTIRTHITSRMCVNAPRHHATFFDDLERVRRGCYRLILR